VRQTRGKLGRRSAALAHEPRLVALPVALLFRLALVGLALALGEAELELGAAALVEINGERHQRDAVALDRAGEPVDLAAMQQQLPRPLGLVIEARGGIERE